MFVARMFHELLSRDRGDGCATGQPQGVGPEAYLNGTSQGPTPEDAWKDGYTRGRSRPFMKHPGSVPGFTMHSPRLNNLGMGQLLRKDVEMTGKENRAHPRARLQWPVSVKISEPVLEGVTKDISAGGAYVCCARPLALNEVFEMSINAPDKSLHVKAEVVWTNVSEFEDKINPQGMGVRFLDISDDDRLFISGAVTEHNTAKQEPDLMRTLELELDGS